MNKIKRQTTVQGTIQSNENVFTKYLDYDADYVFLTISALAFLDNVTVASIYARLKRKRHTAYFCRMQNMKTAGYIIVMRRKHFVQGITHSVHFNTYLVEEILKVRGAITKKEINNIRNHKTNV